MKIKTKHIVYLLLSILVMSSCSHGKKLFNVDTLSRNTYTLNKIKAAYNDFESLNAKLKIDSELFDKRSPLKGNIKIITDSVILISLNLSSGFPLAKIMFTKDQYQLLDRVNKDYFSGNYQEFNAKYKLSIDYFALQALLLNQMIGSENNSDFQIKEVSKGDDQLYFIQQLYQPEEKQTPYQISYFVNKANLKIISSNVLFQEKIMDINYSDFKKSGGKLFPEFYSILLKSEKSTVKINVSWSKIQLNKKQKINFKVPDKYLN